MLILRHEPVGTFGRYSVESDDLLLSRSKRQQEKERQQLARLTEAVATYNRVAALIDQCGFPSLGPPNYKRDADYPLWRLARHNPIGVRDIPCDQITGTNWANMPDHSEIGRYPKPRKVQNILHGYLNLNEDGKDTAGSMKPFPLYHVLDTYLHGEGNHRLYTSRLLGRRTVRVELYRIDYLGLLQTSIVQAHGQYGIIGIRQQSGEYRQHDVSLGELDRFKDLQRQYAIRS